MRQALFMMATLALTACGQGGNGSADAPNNGTVTLELPPATPFNAGQEISSPGNETNMANEATAVESAVEEEQPTLKTAETETIEAKEKAAPAEPAEAAPKEARASGSGEVKLLPARAPLPDTEIVRIIERIGFACGEVTASNRVDNPGGEAVYKINCSSGKSYQGTMKRGRLFFREWTGWLTRD